MPQEFHLKFTTVTCDVCNETRFASEELCGCDESIDASDQNVERRRRLVWCSAPSENNQATQALEISPNSGAWHDISDLLGHVLGALQVVADGRRDGSRRLRMALSELRDKKAAIGDSQHLRPWRAFWRALESAVNQIELVASCYIEAFICDTAPEAEAHAARGQHALDDAAQIAAQFSDLLSHWAFVDDSVSDPLEVLPSVAAAASRATGSESIIDLDGHGRALYTQVTGGEGYETGVGLGLCVTDFVASVLYDSESLWSKASETFTVLTSDSGKLTALAGDEIWLAEYAKAANEFQDAAVEAAALSDAATNDRIEVRAVIRLGARLFEPIARPFLVPLLVVGKGRSLARLITKDPNVTVSQLRQAGLARLTEGLLAGIRDADSHNQYVLDGEFVKLTSNRAEQEQMTRGQLLDSVLLGMETLHAVHAGLTCALVNNGVAVEDLPDTTAWNFTPQQKVALAVGASGWTGVRVTTSNGTMTVTGAGQFPKNPISLGGACIPALPDDLDTLVLHVDSEGAPHTLVMVLPPFRDRSRAEDSWESEAAFLLGCALSTFDGKPIYDSARVRKWVAMKAGEVLSGRDSHRRLESLARLARRVEDFEFADSVDAAIRLQAARVSGHGGSRDDLHKLGLLIEWERRRLP